MRLNDRGDCAVAVGDLVRRAAAGLGAERLDVDLVPLARVCVHLEHDLVDEVVGPLCVLPVLVDVILRVDSVLVEFAERCLPRALGCRLLLCSGRGLAPR